MWTCPRCETKVDPSFDVCWNCGTSADGVEDPNFVRADEAGPLPGDPLFPKLETLEILDVDADLPAPIPGDLVVAYEALDLLQATFLADQLNQAGIPAVSDTHDLHDSLGTMEGGPRVRVRSEDLDRAKAWLSSYERERARTSEE